MLNKPSAALLRVASPVRTVPQVLRLVADLLEAVPGLPELSVSVNEYRAGSPSVSLQVCFWNAPQVKFPAVARLLEHLGGGMPDAKRMPDDGDWHFRGTARWRGTEFTVFASTDANDTGRGDDDGAGA